MSGYLPCLYTLDVAHKHEAIRIDSNRLVVLVITKVTKQ
jgi:hypothetical protein